jgi:hypothetical protein
MSESEREDNDDNRSSYNESENADDSVGSDELITDKYSKANYVYSLRATYECFSSQVFN